MLTATAHAREIDPFDLSLEELLHVEIVSASRHAQDRFSVPSAVHVISARDIERSGATSLGEALRGVPGLLVSRTNNNEWAISARGFNGAFSNKQLVLIDGRTVYDPSFAGVTWDNQELLLADVERIEVIRGPGAALWGANAVNGVINVITRPAQDTAGMAVSVSGAHHHRIAELRYGDSVGDRHHYRVFGKFAQRDLFAPEGFRSTGRDNRSHYGGFRWDSELTERQSLLLSGSLLQRDLERYLSGLDPLTLTPEVVPAQGDAHVGNLLARWRYAGDGGRDHELQFFSNHSDTDAATPLSVDFDTYRLSYQQSHRASAQQLLVWGLEYQHLRYRSEGTAQLNFEPRRGREDDFAIYAHSEHRIDALNLTLNAGLRLEDNTRGGRAVQPKIALGWAPAEPVYLWLSAARATRKPSISDNSIVALGFPVPDGLAELSPIPLQIPLIGELRGQQGIDNEVLDALEFGVRWQPNARWGVDLASFYNVYDDFILPQFEDVRCSDGASVFIEPNCFLASSYLVASSKSGNDGQARSHGAELALRWVPAEALELQASYAYLDLDVSGSDQISDFNGALLSGSSPRHSAALTWRYSIGNRWQFDGQVRRVSRLSNPAVAGYTTFDLRLSWAPVSRLRLALLAQELGDARHLELDDAFDNVPATEVQRSIALQVRYEP
ncbi:MAG: TonB-dependent receptor [Pseudomonadota bacterium]